LHLSSQFPDIGTKINRYIFKGTIFQPTFNGFPNYNSETAQSGTDLVFPKCAELKSQSQGKCASSIVIPVDQPDFFGRFGHGTHPVEQHLLVGVG